MAVVASTTSASLLYIEAARRFAARAAELDTPAVHAGLDKAAKARAEDELLDVALAAVLTANSAVEALINELYIERSLFPNGLWFPGLPDDVAHALNDAWEHGVERYELVVKCQIAAPIAGRSRLNFGAGSAQQMDVLIDLRNTLIHHKPVMVQHGKEAHESGDWIEKRLHKRFDLSRICGRDYPFRWKRCMGAGCARWACETAVAFQRDFFAHIGTEYPKPTSSVEGGTSQ